MIQHQYNTDIAVQLMKASSRYTSQESLEHEYKYRNTRECIECRKRSESAYSKMMTLLSSEIGVGPRRVARILGARVRPLAGFGA